MNPCLDRLFRIDLADLDDWNRDNEQTREAYFTRNDPYDCPGCGRPTTSRAGQCRHCERSDA